MYKILRLQLLLFVWLTWCTVQANDIHINGQFDPREAVLVKDGMWGSPKFMGTYKITSKTNRATLVGVNYDSTVSLSGTCASGVRHGFYRVVWDKVPEGATKTGTLTKYLQTCN